MRLAYVQNQILYEIPPPQEMPVEIEVRCSTKISIGVEHLSKCHFFRVIGVVKQAPATQLLVIK